MNDQYFEALSEKIIRINEYLHTIPNEDLDSIFINLENVSTKLSLQDLGFKLKNAFSDIRKKDEYLTQILKKLNREEKEFFFNISGGEQEEMRKNLRSIAFYVRDLANIYNYDQGGILNRPEFISEEFNNTYQSFIYLVSISQISLKILDDKISNHLNPKFVDKNDEVDTLIKDLKLYKGEASARKTKEIYKQKYRDYKITVEVYELYVMLLVCLSVTLILGQLFAHNFFDTLNISNALMIKLTILALIATLFTYCFKQISFYRKISEQAHQTYMELEALPEFLNHLPTERQNEIRTDLARRYFGQNLFDSIKEDSASIQEQAKANTEVLKSTSTLLEVIKKQNSQS